MSREELLQGIRPDSRITEDLLRKIYGYSVTEPTFADQALTALEQAGHTHARKYYEVWLAQYETGRKAAVKEASAWLLAENNRKWEKLQKEGDERRRQEEVKLLERKKQLLMQKSQLLTRE